MVRSLRRRFFSLLTCSDFEKHQAATLLAQAKKEEK
jgi:hypothetical protein